MKSGETHGSMYILLTLKSDRLLKNAKLPHMRDKCRTQVNKYGTHNLEKDEKTKIPK